MAEEERFELSDHVSTIGHLATPRVRYNYTANRSIYKEQSTKKQGTGKKLSS